ncbi:retrovirus-related pol polyprotein from transposon TNT 1-94 [Tanacetum coccineum]|uniref:Retrovirus-related pol polyprotein from transposon TNT 1-94 n=1 Tax=Tanacetum coccineum TaxID=301880 RepID=A0ABQ4YAM4_9ASTR
MVGGNGGNQFRQYAGQNVGNQNGYNAIQNNENGNVVAARAEGNGNGNNGNQIRCYNCRGMGHLTRNCIFRPKRRDVAYLQTQLLIGQKEEAGIKLQAKEFDLMAAARDLDEIEEVNANCILMANLQQVSTPGTQTDKALVYDSNGLAENDSNIISVVFSVEQNGGTVEQTPATVEETRSYFESLYNILVIKVEKVNSVNRKMKETNVELSTELARYKNQEKCFEINQEKYKKLERCYQKSVYQEQCLTKKINALHLSSAKTITTLNEEIATLNNQLSKEKSTVSYLQQEKKKLKSDFKICEDKLLDKQTQLENKKQLNMFETSNLLQKKADESLAKHKALEFKIEHLLRAVVSQDIMSIVQNPTVV